MNIDDEYKGILLRSSNEKSSGELEQAKTINSIENS